MKTEVGTRVLAILSAKDGVVYVMGEGEYIGEVVPERTGINAIDTFARMGIPNPAIKLDNGITVYGMECWWGPVDKLKAKFANMEFVTVPITQYRPRFTDTACSSTDGDIPSL